MRCYRIRVASPKALRYGYTFYLTVERSKAQSRDFKILDYKYVWILSTAFFIACEKDPDHEKETIMVTSSKKYSRREAAEYLGVAAQTLAKWASDGTYHLPFYKLGKKAVYAQSDLDAFLERQRVVVGGKAC